ncbi:MAG: DUF5615 family PIN-like protein [Pseudomonadota bacterium]
MKFLADMNISLRTVEWLRAQGYDAVHLQEEGLQRAIDEDVLAKARIEDRILLTMDLDFGYLLSLSGDVMPKVILFRLGNETAQAVNHQLAQVLTMLELDEENGLFVTVTNKAIRVRNLPLGKK